MTERQVEYVRDAELQREADRAEREDRRGDQAEADGEDLLIHLNLSTHSSVRGRRPDPTVVRRPAVSEPARPGRRLGVDLAGSAAYGIYYPIE